MLAKTLLPLAIFMATVCCPASGVELSPSLREAERLYQAGQYEKANAMALEIHKFYPDDLQTLMVLGMSAFNGRDFRKAMLWFKKASAKSPKHPLVIRYTKLLREIEYRHGPLSKDPAPDQKIDDQITAEFYKRNFFGPSFNKLSQPQKPHPLTATASVALPIQHPPAKPDLSDMLVADMAQQAFSEGNYHKSFLFFSQLSAFQPSNRFYLLGKARSAFHMKRYREVINLLGPTLATPGTAGYSSQELKEAKELVENSRNHVFSGE